MVAKRNDPNYPLKVLLEAKELKKKFHIFKNFWFETKVAVSGISLRVHEGEIVGILGPNGAGKSTSLKMISGDLVPDEGSIYFNGQDVTEWPMYKRCNNGLGYMAQDNTLFKQMSVENNLLGVMQMQGFSKQEAHQRSEELMEMFDLTRLRNNMAARLSGGEKRRLEVARALTKRPKMLILDEPFAGVDPKVIQTVRKLVVELRQKWGIAILITDHNVPNIVQLVEWAYVIDGGKVIFEGPPEELLRDSAVQESYLGDNGFIQLAATNNGNERININRQELSNEQAEYQQFPQSDFQQEVQPITQSVVNPSSVQRDNINTNSYDNINSQLTSPTDSEYSESDFIDDYQPEGESEKLASFIPRPDSENNIPYREPFEQTSNQDSVQNGNPIQSTPIQPKRKNQPSSPVIKPFRRKN